jgi:type I restriction enzyme M protein
MVNFGKRTPFGAQHLKPFEACYELLHSVGWAERSDAQQSELPATTSPSQCWASQAQHQPTLCDFAWMADDVAQLPENSRLRNFTRAYIRDTKNDSLDISWLKDNDSVDAANLPEPEVLAGEAMSELTEALRELDALMNALGASGEAETQKKLLAEVLGLGDGVTV